MEFTLAWHNPSMLLQGLDVSITKAVRRPEFIFGLALAIFVFTSPTPTLASSDCPSLTEADFSKRPDWFPKTCCARAWNRKVGRPYIFDYEKYGQSENHEGERYLRFLSDSLKANSVPRDQCFKKWTVLIAMDGDSDLYPYSLWDISEMEARFGRYYSTRNVRAGSTLRKDVLVQHQGVEDDIARRFHIFESPREYNPDRIRSDFEKGGELASIHNVLSPIVEAHSIQEERFDSKSKRFSDFLKWGMRKYPSQHYMVIYWGHGKGWMIKDESGKAHLSGLELRDALKEVAEAHDGLQSKGRIDNFVADACYMQGIETATEVSNYVRYISGSAQIQSFLGLPYRTLFYEMDSSFPALRKASDWLPKTEVLKRGSSAWSYEPTVVGKLLPILMSKHVSENGYGGRIDRAMMEADLEALGNREALTFSTLDGLELQRSVIPKLERLAGDLEKLIETKETTEERAEIAGSILDRIWKLKTFKTSAESRELGSFLAILRGFGASFDQKIDSLLNSIDKATVYSLFGNRYDKSDGFRALNVWLPKNKRSYQDSIVDFSALEGFKSPNIKDEKVNVFGNVDSNWHKFLNTVFEYGE
ncbi:MAG: hypothetical protein KDD25_00745 [Bdellovibrionales bacterium]|nr:hypothetical protein [Bdellovibrionales bacterium]